VTKQEEADLKAWIQEGMRRSGSSWVDTMWAKLIGGVLSAAIIATGLGMLGLWRDVSLAALERTNLVAAMEGVQKDIGSIKQALAEDKGRRDAERIIDRRERRERRDP